MTSRFRPLASLIGLTMVTALHGAAEGEAVGTIARKALKFYNASGGDEHASTSGLDGADSDQTYSARVQKHSGVTRFKDGRVVKHRLAAASVPASTSPAVLKEEAEFLTTNGGSIVSWVVLGIFSFVMAPAFVLLFDRRAYRESHRPGAFAPALPEALREVVLLGRRYFVRWHHGQVLDQEAQFASWQRSRSFVDEAGQMRPIEDQTVGDIPRKDALWVGCPDGVEVWIFAEASMHARPNEVVSGLSVTLLSGLRHGNTGFIVTFNHTTGRSAVLAGLTHANRARKFPAFSATTLCGAVAFHLPIGFPALISTHPIAMAVVVSAIVVPLSAALVTTIRNARFRRHYLPLFLETLARLEVPR